MSDNPPSTHTPIARAKRRIKHLRCTGIQLLIGLDTGTLQLVWKQRVVGGLSACDFGGWSRSAAADFGWRPRARDEAASRRRPPGLVRLVLWCSRGRRSGSLRRWGSGFRFAFGPNGSRPGVVLLQAAVFVFAARAAMTGLIAPRSCVGWSSHWREVYRRDAFSASPAAAQPLESAQDSNTKR